MRKYSDQIPHESSVRFWGWLSVALIILGIVSIYIRLWFGVYIKRPLPWSYMISDSQQPLALFIAISTFMFFKNLRIKNSKLINTIAASSFGVLLIHANPDFVRQWLWEETIDGVGHYDTSYYWLYAIACVFAIYIVCTLIDIVRIKTIETPLLNATESLCLRLYSKFNKR